MFTSENVVCVVVMPLEPFAAIVLPKVATPVKLLACATDNAPAIAVVLPVALRLIAAAPPILRVVTVLFSRLNVVAVDVISPPFTAKSPVSVVLPVTPKVDEKVAAPVKAKVLENVAAPVRAKVLLIVTAPVSVDAPVTASVEPSAVAPPTVRVPVAEMFVNSDVPLSATPQLGA